MRPFTRMMFHLGNLGKMTFLISDKRYLLVMSVLQGHNYPIRYYEFVRVDVKFDGQAFSFPPVRLTKDPVFDTAMAFHLTGKQLKDHKLHKTPIKIEVYRVNIRTKKQHRIGFQTLDLRNHAMEVGKPRFTWFDLLGTQTCCAKPQICLGVSLDNDIESENFERNQLESTRTSRMKELAKRHLLVISVLQGRKFSILPTCCVQVDVKFNGETLTSLPVRLTKHPVFETDIAFSLTGKQLRDHRIRKTPIKIEVYHVNERTEEQETIGYQILDLRTHAMEIGKPKFSWFGLLGTQTSRAKPEMHLGVSVVDDIETENVERNQPEFTRTSRRKILIKTLQPKCPVSASRSDAACRERVEGTLNIGDRPVASLDVLSTISPHCGFSKLPDEIVHHIFSLMDGVSKLKLRRVSKRFKNHLDDPEFYSTLEVDSEALINPWFCGFIEERGILPHVQRLVLYSRYEMAKNPPDEPSADLSSLPVPRWSDSLYAVSAYFNHFKDRGCILQEICLRDTAVCVHEFSSRNERFPAFKPPCKVRLSNVDWVFKGTPCSLSEKLDMRLFCDDFTINPTVGAYDTVILFNHLYTIPRCLYDFIRMQIHPLTRKEVEGLKKIYRQLVEGRPDCVIRIEALHMLSEYEYYKFPKESMGSYVEFLPRKLRLKEFDFENLSVEDQYRFVHFSKARHFFQFMPDPQCRKDHTKFVHRLLHPE